MLDVALLGTSGMMPLAERYLTALYVRYSGKLLLIDCGEATQVTVRLLGWGFKNLQCICITHFHADHISGLPGMLLTLGNSGKTDPLTIIGPIGLTHVVKSLLVIAPELPFEIIYKEFETTTNDILVDNFLIDILEVDHRTKCFGYKIKINRNRKFVREKALTLNIPVEFWSELQKNKEVYFEGKTFYPEDVLLEKRKGIEVCYITDTRPTDDMVSFVKDCDLFVGEGIHGDDSLIERAKKYKHSMFSETAKIGSLANVKKLWLTHYSPSLIEPLEYEEYVKNIFENTTLGYDRMTITILFEDQAN